MEPIANTDYIVIGAEHEPARTLRERLREGGAKVRSFPQLTDALEDADGALAGLALLDATREPLLLPCGVTELRKHQPLMEVVPCAARASGGTVVQAMRAGAVDFLLGEDVDAHLARLAELRDEQRLSRRLVSLHDRVTRQWRYENFLSRSRQMWDLFALVDQVAPSTATVLIQGDTGTGKELLARALHHRSLRHDKAFLAVDCGAMTDTLLSSELFGHEKGAFTGASSRKVGLLEMANEGTLFLDEIGNVSEAMQLRLLRALETGCFRRVGGRQEIHTDVRIVAATNADLWQQLAAGRFREDLYYRLNVIQVAIPPLRERPEDILFLLDHFLRSFAEQYRVRVPKPDDEVLDRFLCHEWPGNVRELQNSAERLVLVARGGTITRAHLPPSLGGPKPAGADGAERRRADLSLPLQDAVEGMVAQLECDYLKRLLEKHQGRVQESAKAAGISRRTLYRKMREYELDKTDFRHGWALLAGSR